MNHFIRRIEGANETGAAPVADGQQVNPGHLAEAAKAAQPEENVAESSPQAESEPEEDPNARGSKQAVLADLSKERQKRHTAENERDALTSERDELVTERDQLLAERDELKSKLSALEKSQSEAEYQRNLEAAAREAKIPAEMVGSLKFEGTTAEELKAEAKELALKLGYDRAPIDPSQGLSGGVKPRTMSEAISRKLGINLD